MGLRVLFEGLRRRWRSKLVALLTVAAGTAVLGALLHLTAEGGDRLALDLRGYGANITVTARDGGLLRESDLPRIKTIFWRHNVVAFAPELEVTVEDEHGRFPLVGTWFDHAMPTGDDPAWRTGQLALEPSWADAIEGTRPHDGDPAAVWVGSRLAAARGWRVGDVVHARREAVRFEARVAGILRTGDEWEGRVVAPLRSVQPLRGPAAGAGASADTAGAVSVVRVGALAKPDDELVDAVKAGDEALTFAEAEKMACSPYLSTIAAEIEEALPGSLALPAVRVAQAEREYLSRLSSVLALLAGASALLTCLGVYGAVRASLVERREEMGLLRALGARTTAVAALFVGEGVVLGALGALAGALSGWLLASELGRLVFGEPLAFRAEIVPLLVLGGVVLATGGAALAIRSALRQEPIALLRAAG